MRTVYLAGDMKSGWQDTFANIVNGEATLLDPRSHGLSDPAAYTRWDLDAVAKSDAVVVFMGPHNPSGYGLCVEAGYAHALGIPTFFVDALGNDWRSRYFDMVRQISTVVGTFVEAWDRIRG